MITTQWFNTTAFYRFPLVGFCFKNLSFFFLIYDVSPSEEMDS